MILASSAHFRAVVDTFDLSDNKLENKQNDGDGDGDGDGGAIVLSLIVRKSRSDYS